MHEVICDKIGLKQAECCFFCKWYISHTYTQGPLTVYDPWGECCHPDVLNAQNYPLFTKKKLDNIHEMFRNVAETDKCDLYEREKKNVERQD